MVKRSWLFALLLAVPLIAFLVSAAVQGHMNSQLREALRAEYPDADPGRVASATVDDLCTDGSTGSLATVCGTNASLKLMKAAALWSAGIAMGLLLAIWLAGLVARSNRSLLAYVFRPGLYLTVLVLVGLVITHAALAMATIYFGESALVNRIHAGCQHRMKLHTFTGCNCTAGEGLSLSASEPPCWAAGGPGARGRSAAGPPVRGVAACDSCSPGY